MLRLTKEQIIDLINDHLGDEIRQEDLVNLCFPQSDEIRILDFVDSLSDFDLGNCEGLFLCGQKHPTAHYRTIEINEGYVLVMYDGPNDATNEQLVKAYEKMANLPEHILVEVELLAFDQHERIRTVEIHVEDMKSMQTTEDVLSLIYKLGQNDYQSKPMPSISAGDVIHYSNKLYLVCRVGFDEIDEKFMKEYKSLPQRDRSFHERVRGK